MSGTVDPTFRVAPSSPRLPCERDEILYAAAGLMRTDHGPGHVRYAMWHALANLLERAADTHLDHQALPAGPYARALAVARAYLAERGAA